MEREQIVSTLRKQIKLYEHLGVTVLDLDAGRVRLGADLQKNLNHKATAFGGSIYSVAVLAAYSLVLTSLKEHRIESENIVIAKGEIKYLRPIEEDFEALCEWTKPGDLMNFIDQLLSAGSVREDLRVKVICRGSVCAVFNGTFVVRQ